MIEGSIVDGEIFNIKLYNIETRRDSYQNSKRFGCRIDFPIDSNRFRYMFDGESANVNVGVQPKYQVARKPLECPTISRMNRWTNHRSRSICLVPKGNTEY